MTTYVYVRKEPVRFDFVSVPDFSSKIHRFVSVRFGKLIFPVRRGSACAFRTRRGSDRTRFRVRFRPVPEFIKRFGSARFGRFGSVSYSFLVYVWSVSVMYMAIGLGSVEKYKINKSRTHIKQGIGSVEPTRRCTPHGSRGASGHRRNAL